MTLPTNRMMAAAILAAAVAGATPSGAARAVVPVDNVARVSRLSIDVWTNKEEGGVYRQGERMKIFFRPNVDSYVLIYNIDTEGFIHLIYPYGPEDPERLEGGRTYQIPSRQDPYDLVADGPQGIEYVVALAAPFPYRDLPWYLSGRLADEGPPPGSDEGDEDSGVIVGDPYLGMDRIVRRIVPPGREDDVATADTYFYIERRVEYPRYVCADCHSHGIWYDPYYDHCSVIDIRIDATWARYAPLRSRVLRPRYYYTIRSTAGDRYRGWKERWSSLDGRVTLRQRFHVEGETKQRARRDVIQKRTPPEFKDLRRTRPGRFWQGRDEVLKRKEERQRDRDGAVQNRDDGSSRGRGAEQRREDLRERRDRSREEPQREVPREERGRREQRREEQQRQEQRREERQREEPRREERQREERPRDQAKDDSKREERSQREERQQREDRGSDQRNDSQGRGRDRDRGR